VTLADGTQEKIGKIVNQKLPVEVLSYDFDRGELVAKPVTDWFDNGVAERFLQFTVERGGGNGRAQFAATENHLISTPAGWRAAGEFVVGDRVLQAVPQLLSDYQWQVILGGLMGDGALSPSRSGNGARFRWGHGARQVAYGDWKASLFANLQVSRSTNAKGAVFHDVQPLTELAELREAVYIGAKKVLSDDYLKRLTPLSLAMWYMDDASFALRSKGLQARTQGGSGRIEICVEAMSPDSRARVTAYLAETWGIQAKLTHRGAYQKAVLQFPTAESAKFQALIAPFVHPSMDYKLLPRYRGRFEAEPVFTEARQVLMPMRITKIAVKPPTRSMHRFDMEVAGTHNFFVDGVMVHNSPETTPGGRALKFYSSVRLDIRRIESLKDGAELVGNRTRVKVVKNKCASPFRQAEFDIMYGKGISREGSLLDMAVDLSIIRKSGAWFTYEGEQLGQGRENAKAFLADNAEIMVEISDKVLTASGLKPGDEELITDGDDDEEFSEIDEQPINLDR
jgi:recombination protein RecA